MLVIMISTSKSLLTNLHDSTKAPVKEAVDCYCSRCCLSAEFFSKCRPKDRLSCVLSAMYADVVLKLVVSILPGFILNC